MTAKFCVVDCLLLLHTDRLDAGRFKNFPAPTVRPDLDDCHTTTNPLRVPRCQLTCSFASDSIPHHMAGQSTGERVPGKKYRQVVEAAAVGDPTNRIARNLKLSWPTVRAIIQ